MVQRQICVLAYRILRVFMYPNLNNAGVTQSKNSLQANWNNTLLKLKENNILCNYILYSYISNMKIAIIN